MEIKIDKATFNRFDISTQIKHFNAELKKGFSITEICSSLNISYNTIRDRFLRNHYTYNKFNKQYELSNSLINIDESSLNKALENIVNKAFTFGQNQIKETNFICNCTGSVTNRSFRIYDTVLKDFVNFCERSNYSQYDILSQFISEGIQKYSK